MGGTVWPLVLLALASAAGTTRGQPGGAGGSSFSFSSGTGTGGFSSSSSSSSSSSGGGASHSVIQQSQPGGQVAMQCASPAGGNVVWYKQEGSRRREIARGTTLSISEPRFHLTSQGYSNVLTIQPTRESDSGLYECESGAAGGGVSKHQFTLTIGRGPPGGAGRTFAAAGAFLGTLMMMA